MGISHDKLMYFGLEYKFLSQYLLKQITYQELFQQLNTAIHQYAKRQMTWMRRIDRQHPNVHFLGRDTPTIYRLFRFCFSNPF